MKKSFHTTVIYPESLPQLLADMDSTQVHESLRVIRLRTQNLVVRQTLLDLPGELQNATVEENFARLLVGGDYPIVHFQDLSAWGSLALPLIAKQLGKRVVISLADYFLLCPDKNLVLPNGKPCGKAIADGQDQQCLHCLAAKTETLAHEIPPLDQFLQKRQALVHQILQQADVVIADSSAIRDGFIRAFGELAEKIQVMETAEVLETSEVYSLYNDLLNEEDTETSTLPEPTAPFIQRLLGNDTQSAETCHLGDHIYQQWLEKQRVRSRDWIPASAGMTNHLVAVDSSGKGEKTAYKIHLLIHLRRSQEKYLNTTLEALSAQAYPHWQLSILADFSTTNRLVWEMQNLRWRQIDSDAIRALNHEIAVIQADWVALIEAGDGFEPQLLSDCMRYIDTHPAWQLIYVDEDSITTRQERYDPKFKPDFNLELLRAMPYLGSFCLVRRDAQQAVGGYAPYSGMENYDMALKVLDLYGAAAIGHIAQMLYHRLDINEVHHQEGTDILRQHLKRHAIRAEIHNTDFPGICWVDYALQEKAVVSIIIATRNSLQGNLALRENALQRCLESLIQITAYADYEIIVVDNASTEPNTLAYLETLESVRPESWVSGNRPSFPKQRKLVVSGMTQGIPETPPVAQVSGNRPSFPKHRIRVLHYPVEASVSALNNFAAQQASGEYLLFLNDDTEIIQADWLQRLLAYNQQKQVGIVGARLLDTEQNVLHAGLILGMGTVGIAGQINQGLAHNALGYMGRNQAAQNLAAVSEYCLMINKSLYQTLGGMDDKTCHTLFSEVDLCLKAKQAGYQIIWTPHVSLIQHGTGSLVRHRHTTIADEQVGNEIATMYQRWLPQLSDDAAYNPHLGLKGSEWQPETLITVPWDVRLPEKPLAANVKESGVQSGALQSFGLSPDDLPQEKPRIVAYPYDAWGIGEYRVRAPLRVLQKAGLVDYALMPNHDVLRMPTPTELARMQTDTLFLHNMLHDDNLTALAHYKRFNQCFKVFGQDDLIYALPKTNPYYYTNYKDIKERVHTAISLCERFIVATEPLAEAYRAIRDDIWIMPNYLEYARWCDVETVAGDKPDRFPKPVRFVQNGEGVSQKPRVGWAGAKQHLGDLQLILQVVKALANEIDWVFLGMCPDELRPYVQEYHEMVPFEHYPAKLASLHLDLAIAPLEMNAFNEAKSNLRLLEYGILGYPVVCSDIYPYQHAPVTRVPNTHQAWLNAIRAQVYDLKATKRAGHQLKQWVLDNWILENHIEKWAQALNILGFGKSASLHSRNNRGWGFGKSASLHSRNNRGWGFGKSASLHSRNNMVGGFGKSASLHSRNNMVGGFGKSASLHSRNNMVGGFGKSASLHSRNNMVILGFGKSAPLHSRNNRVIKSPVASPHCIFILGCEHSGTYLLASLLCQHASIETAIEQQAWLGEALTMPTEIAIPELWTEKENWVVQLPGDDKAREFEQQKQAWLASLQQPSGGWIAIDNLPVGMAKSLWLQEQFPGACFILMVRNGYAVALELQQKIRQAYEIQPLLLHRAARQWTRSLEIFQEAVPKLDNVLEVRYEELLANPAGVMANIFEFVHLPPLNVEVLRESVQRQDSPFATSPQNAKSLARMSAAEWAVIKQCAGEMLGYYGY